MSPAVTSPDPQPPANPTRRRLMSLLKVGVTVLGLGLVWRNLDVAAILEVIGQVQVGWMAAGAALMILSLIVRAYRWHLILHGVGSAIRFGHSPAFARSWTGALDPRPGTGRAVRPAAGNCQLVP